jgi:RES domain-containing protein
MVLYRLAKCVYADDLSGTGARLYGGRWNSEGKAALYLASSGSLAVLEVLVHLPPLMIPNGYCITEISVPENSIFSIKKEELPDNWKDIAQPVALRKIGDQFLTKHDYLLLKVPSAIVPFEYNYVMNPGHPAFKDVHVLKKQAFDFDERLI